MTSPPAAPAKALWRHITGYSMGQALVSLTVNGISAYAMLYYTQARGLSYTKAGLAIAVASLWDAVADPAIGHLSDNTHTRWGRRQPYILSGGLLMAATFYLLWAIPSFVIQGGLLFPYLLVINLLFRTAFGIFYVPYCALGFEVCTDYHQRSQLQSTGIAASMAANLLGPALGWYLFFPDGGGKEATSTVANFLHMGAWFSAGSVLLTIVVVLATRRYMTDTRGQVTGTGNSPGAFFADWREIFADRRLQPVLLFYCVGFTGTVFVGMMQMYLYVYFAHYTSLQKMIVHGGGMVLFASGAGIATFLARKWDKKYAVCAGSAVAAAADLAAVILFGGGILKPGTVWSLAGHGFHVGIVAFAACDMLNWLGAGAFCALGPSMVSDAAEADELDSGVRKDGGYSAIFCFTWKLVNSLATFIAGASLAWVGFASGSDQQSPQAIHHLILLAFGIGSLFSALIIPIALRCPIDRPAMTRIKLLLQERKLKTP